MALTSTKNVFHIINFIVNYIFIGFRCNIRDLWCLILWDCICYIDPLDLITRIPLLTSSTNIRLSCPLHFNSFFWRVCTMFSPKLIITSIIWFYNNIIYGAGNDMMQRYVTIWRGKKTCFGKMLMNKKWCCEMLKCSNFQNEIEKSIDDNDSIKVLKNQQPNTVQQQNREENELPGDVWRTLLSSSTRFTWNWNDKMESQAFVNEFRL